MGKRGPKKTPTAVLKLRGSDEVRYRKDEPTLDLTRPVPPPTLTDAAREVWERTVDLLYQMGVTTDIDAATLARYSTGTVRFWAATKVLEEQGETYPLLDKEGNLRCYMPRPEVAIAARLMEQLLRIEVQFGMTPASRPDVKSMKKPAGDPMADLLNRRKQGG